jgi:PQQ-dependent dehydrogenase (methanol/ethanol family)
MEEVMNVRMLSLSLVALGAALASGCKSNEPGEAPKLAAHERGAAAVDQQRLENADREPGSWLAAGRDYNEQRFSPLNQINDRNIGSIGLGLAWYGDIDTERGQEATPIVVDGMLYVTTAWSMVKAYDVKTGQKVWEYDPKVDKAKGADACCDVVNRGVAAWKGKIYLGALDGRLIALDGKTGAVVWSVQTTDPTKPYTITGVPRIVHDKVIIGQGGAEYRVRGYVDAYDAADGKHAWRWYVVPGDPSKPYETPEMEMAAKTWKGDNYWKIGGGGTPWDGFAYDPELNTLYVGTGNGNPWNQAIRSPGGGDNLFLSSIVALDPDTGKYKWHYQTTPGETWDYTAVQPLIVAELKFPEGKRKVVMQAPKNGFFYVLDARTGKLISAEKFAPNTWATKVDMATGRPVEVPEARFDKTGKATIVSPAALGMHNWHPMAYSPKTGYVYIPVTVSSAVYAPVKGSDFKLNLQGWNTGIGFSASGGETPVVAMGAAPKTESYILAWDPVKAKEVWRIPNKVNGATGILATDGNLIFSGNHNGEFVAYDATTGKQLWSAPTGARVVAAPAAFMVDGQQEVAILAGARGLPPGQNRTSEVSANNSRILVFKAGGTAKLPAALPAGANVAAAARIDPPLLTASNETVAQGEGLFLTNCSVCHGRNVVPAAGATAPDLRYSALLRSPENFNHAVLDGDRAQRGMPGFKATLSDGDSAALLAYIIKRANDEKAAQEASSRQ